RRLCCVRPFIGRRISATGGFRLLTSAATSVCGFLELTWNAAVARFYRKSLVSLTLRFSGAFVCFVVLPERSSSSSRRLRQTTQPLQHVVLSRHNRQAEATPHFGIVAFQAPAVGKVELTHCIIGCGGEHRTEWRVQQSHEEAILFSHFTECFAECAHECRSETAVRLEAMTEDNIVHRLAGANLGESA